MKRRPISKRTSKKIFARTASNPHPKNIKTTASRGGIRL